MKQYITQNFNISPSVFDFGEEVLKSIDFKIIDDIARYNQLKVLKAFQNNRVSDVHFNSTTGYGYDDAGREVIDNIYAEVFGAEDALVRHNIINGTHAISLCLFAVLRPGDTLVAVTGKPYDTLEEVIGICGENNGSLKDFGVNYKQVDLIDGKVDYNKIMSTIDKSTKAVIIQKSKGYSFRPSLSCDDIKKIIETVKGINPDTICIVDNCYGEFAEKIEPTQAGVDLMAG
ncbi:MAG: methionine gamma-lyase family protein, partial [Clostridia bacterium]|nr:methionine gamma-lyase family protein [Clostridia bacterium]